MARLLEDAIKRLLTERGLPVPVHATATSPEQAVTQAMEIGLPVVVKALVPTGRRGKAGAVRFCNSARDVAVAARDLLGGTVGGYPVESLLVEERLDIAHELYLAFEIARDTPAYTVLLSASGGIEIEEHPETITRREFDPNLLPTGDWFADLWRSASETLDAGQAGDVSRSLLDLFVEGDLTLLEINPLAVLTNGRLVCAGALAAVDDNALARQPDLRHVAVEGTERAWRPETDLEARVTAINADRSQRGSARYLELEGGNIGFLCGGGGASLLLFDAVVAAGGRPANYSEFGGNPTEQRVYDLTRVVLDKPGVEGLFVAHNLTNNTQVDVVAAGVTRALRDAGLPASFPVVAREAGLHDEEGRRIFEAAGVRCFGEETTLDAAAAAMVDAMRAAGKK